MNDHKDLTALAHIERAEREAAQVPEIEGVTPSPVNAAAVIGAGAMGAGIATCFAAAGIAVTLVDIAQENVDRGLAAARANLGGAVAKGKMTAEDHSRALKLLSGATDYAELKGADLIIEAVFENLDLKRKVFAGLDRAAKRSAILATNTSYLDIDAIAAATARPEKVLGLHFFNPAHVMKLLEIVRGAATSRETLAAGADIARRLQKTGVVAKNSFGFIGNRMLNAYRTEALNLALEGASIAAIDEAVVAFGMPMGPFALMDLTGLDVNVKMRAEADPSRIDTRAFRIVDRLYEMGRTGKKSGAGFYLYEAGAKAPAFDPAVDAMIAEDSKIKTLYTRAAAEIADRCILALVIEGARILAEGVAQRSGDIDVTYVAGYGFPRALGGPMCWAERQGLAAVAARIDRYHAETGAARWRPAPLLKAAAKAGAWSGAARPA
jgi:3-hydroxyacyl-CoA dehydrogenase